MSTLGQPAIDGVEPAAGTRIAAYQLTDYLERIGVEVVFGLCGHTVIALLDALGKSRIKFISTRHEQIAAHAADGYARATGKPGVVLSHLGPGLTNAATGVANAALDSVPDGRDRRRRAVVFSRAPSPSGNQPAPRREPAGDLPAVLQARVSGGSAGGFAADHGTRVSSGPNGPSGARAGGRADGHLLGRPAERRVFESTAHDRAARPSTPKPRPVSCRRWPAPSARCSMRAAA